MPAAVLSPEEKKKKQLLARDGYLRRNYGIGLDEYNEMLEKQGGRCAICLCRPRTRNLAVDHDHLTGALRGLLCGRCNHGLLQFAQEDIVILKRAVEYLISYLEVNRSDQAGEDRQARTPRGRIVIPSVGSGT